MSASKRQYRFGPVTLVVSPLYRFVTVGKRVYFFPEALYRIAYRIRDLMPQAWAFGLRSCDEPHYGNVYTWRTVWIWNRWHLNRVVNYMDGASDGPAFCQRIPMAEYVRRRIGRAA